MLLSNLLRKGMVPKAQDLGILSSWDDIHYMGLGPGRSHIPLHFAL